MKVFITKHALTTGIEEREVEFSSDDSTMVCHAVRWGVIFYHRGEWHESIESAQRKARQMQERKIAALEKQLAKLRALTFDVQPEIAAVLHEAAVIGTLRGVEDFHSKQP